MNAFLEQLSKIGPARLIIMFGVAAGVAGALVAVGLRVGEGDKALLYADLEFAEVSEIALRLEQSGIDYEIAAGGTAVRVAAAQVDQARILLSTEGLPTTGSVGYELFDSQNAMGATQFVQNINRVRAMEGELARTIAAIDGVASARVHLALPERRLFDRDASTPKASVWVELRHADLAGRQTRSIRNLVAGAVPGLSPSQVTILDSEGRLLASGSDDPEALSAMAMGERKSQMEERLRRGVEDMVERIVGPGAVRVQVAVEADFDRIVEDAEIFDPDQQVVRSTELTEETLSESDTEPDGAASVTENVPGADGVGDSARRSESATNRTTEVVNYEISRTTRRVVREIGAVKRLSIAVAVDGTTGVDADGAPTYAPRAPEEMERIAALVRSAVGFDAERGDTIEIANVRFARSLPLAATSAASPLAFDKNDILRGVELLVLLIVAVMIIFLVARPLLKGAVAAGPAAAGPPALATGAAAATATLTGEGGEPAALPAPEEDEERVDIAKIEGQVKASSVKKVAEIVQNHPDESVAILRTWLHESG